MSDVRGTARAFTRSGVSIPRLCFSAWPLTGHVLKAVRRTHEKFKKGLGAQCRLMTRGNGLLYAHAVAVLGLATSVNPARNIGTEYACTSHVPNSEGCGRREQGTAGRVMNPWSNRREAEPDVHQPEPFTSHVALLCCTSFIGLQAPISSPRAVEVTRGLLHQARRGSHFAPLGLASLIMSCLPALWMRTAAIESTVKGRSGRTDPIGRPSTVETHRIGIRAGD